MPGHPAAATPSIHHLLMKTIRPLALLIALTPALLHAQGSLTPPSGPPVASMKTLDQVEARTPLEAGAAGVVINAAGTITISQPGSYYLTGNRTITTTGANGIVISADGVTLDLNGFALICTGVNGGIAVNLGSVNAATVRRGSILGGSTVAGSVFSLAGWDKGINGTGSDLRVSDINARGLRTNGIFISTLNSSVERCSVNICGGSGIQTRNASDTTVRNCGDYALSIGNPSSGGCGNNCLGESVGASGYGIYATGSVLTNCRGIAIGGNGLHGGQVTNCQGASTSGWGIFAANATNCEGSSSTNVGLKATNATNCTGTTNSGTAGIAVTGTASYCQAGGSGTAMTAAIAIGCTSAGGVITAPQKHLGTP